MWRFLLMATIALLAGYPEAGFAGSDDTGETWGSSEVANLPDWSTTWRPEDDVDGEVGKKSEEIFVEEAHLFDTTTASSGRPKSTGRESEEGVGSGGSSSSGNWSSEETFSSENDSMKERLTHWVSVTVALGRQILKYFDVQDLARDDEYLSPLSANREGDGIVIVSGSTSSPVASSREESTTTANAGGAQETTTPIGDGSNEDVTTKRRAAASGSQEETTTTTKKPPRRKPSKKTSSVGSGEEDEVVVNPMKGRVMEYEEDEMETTTEGLEVGPVGTDPVLLGRGIQQQQAVVKKVAAITVNKEAVVPASGLYCPIYKRQSASGCPAENSTKCKSDKDCPAPKKCCGMPCGSECLNSTSLAPPT